MHISVRLPKLEPNALEPPTRCPLKSPKTGRRCTGARFKLHQVHCCKPVRDLRHTQVIVQRYRCLKCHRAFRVYPQVVSHDQLTASLKTLMLAGYLVSVIPR
jgi:hypothetical protein